MTCDEFDSLLHPYVDEEFEDDERLEAERHLAICEDCARKVHFERQFREGLRSKLREVDVPAPDSLRHSVLHAFHQEQRRERNRQVATWASAAAVVVAVGSVTFALWPKNREKFVLDAAKWHSRSLPFEIAARPHDAIEQWFAGKLDHRVNVPRFPNLQLAGARLSNVEDRPAAYIRYQKPDAHGSERSVGLFVFDDAQNEVDADPLPSVDLENKLGYNVALWRDGEIVYEMVTDLDEHDIRALLAAQEKGPSRGVHPVPTLPPPTAPASDVSEGVQVQPASLRQ